MSYLNIGFDTYLSGQSTITSERRRGSCDDLPSMLCMDGEIKASGCSGHRRVVAEVEDSIRVEVTSE